MFRRTRALVARCAARLRGSGPGLAPASPPEALLVTPIPSLVSLLLRAEDEKGSPLTREEVESIRDKCVCIVLRASAVAAIADRRGYDDIDPEQAWEQWQIAREELRGGGNAAAEGSP